MFFHPVSVGIAGKMEFAHHGQPGRAVPRQILLRPTVSYHFFASLFYLPPTCMAGGRFILYAEQIQQAVTQQSEEIQDFAERAAICRAEAHVLAVFHQMAFFFSIIIIRV